MKCGDDRARAFIFAHQATHLTAPDALRMASSGLIMAGLLLALPARSHGQQRQAANQADQERLRWISIPAERAANGIQVHGLPWFADNIADFGRLPLSAQANIPAAVWNRSREPSGGRIRFRSNTLSLSVRLQADSKLAQRSTMSDQGSRGLDVYVDGAYWKSVIVNSTEVHERVAFTGVDRRERDITIYLPIGQPIKSIAIGVDSAAIVGASPPFAQSKPIVFYGSSVAQGSGVSRSGMTYEAILARKLNMDFVNLGFGGAGKAEPAVVELVASVDACCFVFDLGRSYGDQDKTAYRNMLTTVRAKRPQTPLVCVLPIYNPIEHHDQSWKARSEHTRAAFRQAYEELKSSDGNLYLVGQYDLIKPTEGDSSNEGVHPTDFGYFLMAERLSEVLRPLLP
jgi:lysophospholipase L1-like esterase